MMIKEADIKVGDLVAAVSVDFAGDPGLVAGTLGLVKKISPRDEVLSEQVLIYWLRYNYQTWEHPESIKVMSSVKK